MMTYKVIAMEQDVRKDHFTYFQGMGYPYMGVTVNVDITDWLAAVKSQKLPFFHSFLYVVANAANQVPQLRQRIKDGGVIEYEHCPSSYTVALENGTYGYCTLQTQKPFKEFLEYAAKEQRQAVEQGGIDDGEDALALFFISSLPWFSYSALVQPVPSPADSNPRITWGRYFVQETKTWIPVSLLCHHALVDGMHLNLFFEQLYAQLKAFVSYSKSQ